jgi:hypothetical protein
MRNYVNLLSDDARLRWSARSSALRWSLALAALVAALAPITQSQWRQTRDVRRRHEALEARYAPIRLLSDESRQYRKEAVRLVTADRIPLELSRERPLATLLGLASQAAAGSSGELYVEQLTLTQSAVDDDADAPAERRLVLKATGTLAYDVANVIATLEHEPIKSVKVLSTETLADEDVPRKTYTIECLY